MGMTDNLQQTWGSMDNYDWYTEAMFKLAYVPDTGLKSQLERIWGVVVNEGTAVAKRELENYNYPPHMQLFYDRALNPRKWAVYPDNTTKQAILAAPSKGYIDFNVGRADANNVEIEGHKGVYSATNRYGWHDPFLEVFKEKSGITRAFLGEGDGESIEFDAEDKSIFIEDNLTVYTRGLSDKIIVAAVESAVLKVWDRKYDFKYYFERRTALGGKARTQTEIRLLLRAMGVTRIDKDKVTLNDNSEVFISEIKLRVTGKEPWGDGGIDATVIQPYVEVSRRVDPKLQSVLLFAGVFGQKLSSDQVKMNRG